MILWTHFFGGVIPSKKNDRRQITLKTGRRINIPSARYVKWHKMVLPELLAKRPDKPMEQVAINLEFVYPDKRRRDTDNGESSVMDTLIDAQIIKDDCWTIVPDKHVHGRLVREGEEPGCHIYISNA